MLFLVDASPLAIPDPAAATLLQRAMNAAQLEEAAKKAVRLAEEAAEAAKKVAPSPPASSMVSLWDSLPRMRCCPTQERQMSLGSANPPPSSPSPLSRMTC